MATAKPEAKTDAKASSDVAKVVGKPVTIKFQTISSIMGTKELLGGVPVVGTVRPYLFPATIQVESGTRWGELIRTLLQQNLKIRHGPMLGHAFCVNGRNLQNSLSDPIKEDTTITLVGLVPSAKDLSEAFKQYQALFP